MPGALSRAYRFPRIRKAMPFMRVSSGFTIAGDEETAAVCQVVDLVPAGDGTIVHLKLLPGLVEDYRALIARSVAS